MVFADFGYFNVVFGWK